MGYESIALIAQYTQWLIAIATVIIGIRIAYIIHSMSNSLDENVSLNTILTKVSKHTKAIIICIIVESIIILVRTYYL